MMEPIQSYETEFIDACAIVAMGHIAGNFDNWKDVKDVAKLSYKLADAMLAEKKARADATQSEKIIPPMSKDTGNAEILNYLNKRQPEPNLD